MKIALHICCAVCASGAAASLQKEGHEVVGFFFNPNIYPEEEYYRRLDSARRVAAELNFPLVDGPYLPHEWLAKVRSFQAEPEGGRRCPPCYRIRLEQTYQFMLDSGCQAFCTTLSMGSNKPAALLAEIGQRIGGETFLTRDFKKKEGFKKALEMARRWELYRQNYCGCQFSLQAKSQRQSWEIGNAPSSSPTKIPKVGPK